MTTVVDRIRRHLRPGALVAVADGAGAPVGLGEALAEAAASVGGVRLLLGWCLEPPVPYDEKAFTDVRSFMGGYALRAAVADGFVRYVPVRLGSLPALLAGPLRPDVVVTALAPGPRGPVWGSEVAWMPAATEAATTVLAEVNHGLPKAAGNRPVPGVTVVREIDRPPAEVPTPAPGPEAAVIGEAVARIVPRGAALQFGPGWIGEAVCRALDVPVSVDSGVLTDSVVDLDRRGLLIGTPRAGYLTGTERLYRWADGRSVLTRVEETHDLSRLAGRPAFVAVNTALEVDIRGQVNVERSGGAVVGGIGGHADYALAAARCPGGLSVLVVPSRRRGRSTLVEQVEGGVSTPRCDIDVVVTEYGMADLRGLDDTERAAALRPLWPDEGATPQPGGGTPWTS